MSVNVPDGDPAFPADHVTAPAAPQGPLARPRRASEQFAFSERRLATRARPKSGARYVFDSAEPGLCVREMPTSAVFVFYRWFRGKPERLTLGKVGTIPLRDVRQIVAGLRGDLARGIDVFTRARAAKQPTKAVTLQDAFAAHVARPDLRPATRADYTNAWKRLPAQLRSKAIAAVDTADLKRLHDAIGARQHYRQANKIIVVISCLLRANGRAADNPAAGIRRFKESPRSRVLTLDELRRLREGLAEEAEPWRSFFLLLLLSGSRRGALAAMRWDDLDLEGGVWRIPAAVAKSRKVTTVALPSEAVGILQRLYAARGAAPWVFPAASQSGHLMDPQRAWRRVCQRACVANACIHDLRRSLGTALAADGAHPALIAAALGHISQASAKAYVHLSGELARAAVEQVAQRTAGRTSPSQTRAYGTTRAA
jgi:integrase